LRLAHLNRCQSPIVNRLRQDLAWQFPEIASVRLSKNGDRLSVCLLWLADLKKSNRYEKLYSSSVGLELTNSVRRHAIRLCDLHSEEIEIEIELSQYTREPEFELYHRVFNRFGFGSRVSAMILSQIYPIENFLTTQGKPLTIYRRGRFSPNRKYTKRYLSRRRFEKALGVAPTEDSSGDVTSKKIVGGSDLCRIALWQWIFTRLEVKRNRPKTVVSQKLGFMTDKLKASGQPVRLIRMKIASHTARLLFTELVKELDPSDVRK
jgi:hypothetical protein